jgi:hypothetical protein
MSQFSDMQPGGPPNPFASTPAGYPPPRRSRAWLWILLGAGGMGALVCCGCLGLFAVGWTQIGKGLQAQLNADPTAKEHLGTVNSATLDVVEMTKVAEKQKGGPPVMVFAVRGDKGSGMVHVEQEAGSGQTSEMASWCCLPARRSSLVLVLQRLV